MGLLTHFDGLGRNELGVTMGPCRVHPVFTLRVSAYNVLGVRFTCFAAHQGLLITGVAEAYSAFCKADIGDVIEA
jgi:hypothetical protein